MRPRPRALFFGQPGLFGSDLDSPAGGHVTGVDAKIDENSFELARIDEHRGERRREHGFEPDLIAHQARQHRLDPLDDFVRVERHRPSELLAANREGAASSTAPLSPRPERPLRGMGNDGSALGMRRSTTEVLNITHVSKLLKSCATPAASRPTDSRRRAWASCSSSFLRSLSARCTSARLCVTRRRARRTDRSEVLCRRDDREDDDAHHPSRPAQEGVLPPRRPTASRSRQSTPRRSSPRAPIIP